MSDLAKLADRARLPPEFQVLVQEFPRADWAEATGPFTSFYLERHEFFRRISEKLLEESERFLGAESERRRFGASLSRLGSMFVTELHGHHMIEDHHYFPRISGLDRRVARAFEILDSDHHALDDSLSRFQSLGNAAIGAIDGEGRYQAADNLRTGLIGLRRLLLRHLEDEEDIVVPLMLKYGEEAALD